MLSNVLGIVLGACVALTVVVAVVQLMRRGRSRMGTAMLVVGGAIVGMVLLDMLLR